MDTDSGAPGQFAALGIPLATARLATFFTRNPTTRPTVRELQRTLAIASASVQRDLARLVAAGALAAQPDRRLIRYAVVPASPIWHAMRLIISDTRPDSPRRERSANAASARAKAYGVDIGQLRSTLRLSPEERITQLDANAAFLRAAGASRVANAAKGLRRSSPRGRARR